MDAPLQADLPPEKPQGLPTVKPLNPAFVPALTGAVICIVLLRVGLAGILFLLPLGIVAYCYNPGTAWLCAFFAVLGNGLFSLALALAMRYKAGEMLGDCFYFTALILGFAWICAPPARGPRFLRIPGVYRLILSSVLGVLALAPVVMGARSDSGFYAFIRAQAETMASLYTASSGADVVRRSLLESYLTPEVILETLTFVSLRGGALASCLFLFFINRQAAAAVSWFIRRVRFGVPLVRFHLEPQLVWVLSFSLLAVLLGLWIKIRVLEIAAWNVLVICGILYLAQGGGILLFFLARSPAPPPLRFFFNLLLVMVFLSPGINAIALGILILLGIAENWVPFRALTSNGSSSTPGT
jgi:hypothetical protein